MIIGNYNALNFPDNEFDCILSCTTLKHDRYFWRSIQEIRRVLRPNGLFVVGVPIYMALPTDYKRIILTYAGHRYAYNIDYYRFSEQSVHDVLLEGCNLFDQIQVRKYPNLYFVAAGVKL